MISVEIVEGSDKLYKEMIDIGNGEIKQICSGLRNHVTVEDFDQKLVVVLTNLRP